MSEYLEEAAKLLRKAAEDNERANGRREVELGRGRERVAMKFAQLAAIDKGLIPTEMVGDLLTQIVRAEQAR